MWNERLLLGSIDMNILDKISDLYSELHTMPFKSDDKVVIEQSFEQGFQKDFQKQLTHKMDKFLNKNQSIIEDIAYIDKENFIPKWFIEYQKRQFQKYEVANHDNFYKAKLNDSFFQGGFDSFGLLKNTRHFRGNTRGYFNEFAAHVNGSAITTGSTASNWLTSANLAIYNKFTTGVIGEYYDQIAIDFNVHNSGSDNIAAYSDSSDPATLYGQSGSFTGAVGAFATNLKSVTEFALTTVNGWIAYVTNGAGTIRVTSTSSSTTARQQTLTFGGSAFTSSPTGLSNFTTADLYMRINHS